MSRTLALVAGMVLLCALGSCMTSRKIATRDDYAKLRPDRPTTVYAQDNRVYRLGQHALGDSVMRGSGTLSHRGDTTRFEGSIPFSEIIAIKTDSRHLEH